jgi:hypothetical protein
MKFCSPTQASATTSVLSAQNARVMDEQLRFVARLLEGESLAPLRSDALRRPGLIPI